MSINEQKILIVDDDPIVLKSLKDRLKNKFNLSVAELDFQEKWQRSKIGIAVIGKVLKGIPSNGGLISCIVITVLLLCSKILKSNNSARLGIIK